MTDLPLHSFSVSTADRTGIILLPLGLRQRARLAILQDLE